MDVRVRILEVHEKDCCVDVNFYTDALLADIEPTRVARTAQLLEENPERSESDCRAQAETEYMPGSRNSIPLYGVNPIPTGQALVDYIMTYAPVQWLAMKVELVEVPTDLSALAALKGSVFSKSVTPPSPQAKTAALPVGTL